MAGESIVPLWMSLVREIAILSFMVLEFGTQNKIPSHSNSNDL